MAFQGAERARLRHTVEGKHTSDRPASQTPARPEPCIVGEFQVFERGVLVRMRVERWPARPEGTEDETPAEAGYGHGV